MLIKYLTWDSIVFSVWKRTLDLAQGLFTANGIHYGRVDGSISTTSQRRRILFDFQRNPEMRVLLMTLGTGAVGYVTLSGRLEVSGGEVCCNFPDVGSFVLTTNRLNNLSVASHVYLLEPQWNPSVEKQAIGRVLRMGQESEVVITRYIMEKSIEDVCETRVLSFARNQNFRPCADNNFFEFDRLSRAARNTNNALRREVSSSSRSSRTGFWTIDESLESEWCPKLLRTLSRTNVKPLVLPAHAVGF
jgi:hypothetical protein